MVLQIWQNKVKRAKMKVILMRYIVKNSAANMVAPSEVLSSCY